MDDELRAWATTWQSMEEHPMNLRLIERARAAYRFEAMLATLFWSGLGVGALLTAAGLGRAFMFGASTARWLQLSFALAAVLTGLWFMLRARRQILAARARLNETPQSLVADLLGLCEQELEAWQGKLSLTVTSVLGLGAIVISIARIAGLTPGESPQLGWASLAFVVIALGALAAVGVRRVRLLRQESAALREIAAQLAGSSAMS